MISLRRLEADDFPVLRDERNLEQALRSRGSWEAAAVSLDGHWWLLDSHDLDLLLLARRPLDDLLAARPETPLVGREATPPVPSLIEQDGHIVGAWIRNPDAVAAEPIARRGGGPVQPEPPVPRGADAVEAGQPARRGGVVPASGGPTRGYPSANGDDAAAAPAAQAPAAEPAGDDDRTLRRTPHLDAPERIAKAPGTTFKVAVYADTGAFEADESGEQLTVELPEGVDSVDVGVLLQVTEHFEVTGAEFGELTLSRGEDASNRAEFELRVAGDGPDEAVISALLTCRGHSCGRVARSWDWSSAENEATPIAAKAVGPVSMPVHALAAQADLSVFVTSLVNDGVNYQCAVETPLLDAYSKASGSIPFAVPAGGYAFMNKLLSALTDADKTPKQRLRALREVGNEAWEAAPSNVKELVWALVDAGKPPSTVYVCSVEPILPWELMIPRRFDGKEPSKLEPLGVSSAIGRWTRADSESPPSRLPVANAFVIAPKYEPEHRALDSKAEVDFLTQHLHGQRLDPAGVDALDERFANEHASLLHFVCHGESGRDNDDAIILDNDEPLRAREMETVSGFETLCQATHPLVFLNSCSTGQMVPSLGGGSGFPRSFGNIGAHAVIAPLWPVADELAQKIALEVYGRALEPDAPPIAAIVRDIRKRGYEAEDVDTYAAYCFYGDPLARLELVDA